MPNFAWGVDGRAYVLLYYIQVPYPIYARVSFSEQMSLSCSQSELMLLNQHIWSIFNLQQTATQSRLIVCPMVVANYVQKSTTQRK